MRAIQIDRYGGPEVLTRRELPIPGPAHGEILIRLEYSGVNFMDIHTREGKYANSRTYPQKMPTTLGIEGAGTVAKLGEGVTDFAEGDRVAYCISWGSYADYAVVPAWRVVKVPDALSLEMAAAATFHGLTAHYLANDLGKFRPGVTALVHAASGGIGQMLVQLGKRAGASILATTSTMEKAEVASRCGAAHAFLYDGFADKVRELTGGKGVDVVFDALGKATFRDSLRAVRTKGLIVQFGAIGAPVNDLNPIELGEAGSLFLTRPRLADYLPDAATIRRRAAEIFAALVDGALTVRIAGRYTFDEVERAHEDLLERRTIGKPILSLK